MSMLQSNNFIQHFDYPLFEKKWDHVKKTLSENEVQQFLKEIIDTDYEDAKFSFFKKVFDKILQSKVSLNFNIDDWPPTFLSLVVHKGSIQLFNYFIDKGADINFIGDGNVFGAEEHELDRYSTCLDFALLKLSDRLTIDYNYAVPQNDEFISSWRDMNSEENITIKKQDYYYLIEQSKYLQEIIHTDRLISHIQSLGGKTFKELNTNLNK